MERNKNQKLRGFTLHHFFNKFLAPKVKLKRLGFFDNFKQNLKNGEGFTLIELLVVVAIIALLTSVALISFMSARQKGRDSKRLSDLVQLNTALELYYSTYKGYPTVAGTPTPLVPGFAATLPAAPLPADGGCEMIDFRNNVKDNNPNVPAGTMGNTYYYYPSGTVYIATNNTQVVPDFAYYFCLGNKTGDVPAGIHVVTPKGIK